MAKRKLSEALDSILGEMFIETEGQREIRSDIERINGKRLASERLESIRLEDIRSKSKRIVSERPRPFRKAQEIPKPINLEDRYYRTDNEIDDLLMPTLTPLEQCVYRLMYRQSYGWGQCICQVGYEEIQKKVGIESRATTQKVVESLISKGCISIFAEKTPRSPRTYRVHLPCEMEFLKERSLRSINERSNSERLNNEPLNVQKVNVNGLKNERIEIERIDELAVSSRENSAEIGPKILPKYNIKDIYKNNNKEKLLLFFSNTPFEPITPEALDWLSRYDHDTVVRYAQEVLAWPGTKNHMALLRAALANKYEFSTDKRDSTQNDEIKAIIEQQAKRMGAEEEAFQAFKNSLPDEEREEIVTRARESLQSDPFYGVLQSEEIRTKYLEGKIEAELRKEFEGRQRGVNLID